MTTSDRLVMEPLEVRPFEVTDRDAVLCLWRECSLIVAQNNPEKDIERKRQVDPDLFLVGVIGDRVIASVMGGYEGHRGWINYLAVKPSEQRKGHGRTMMDAIEKCLRDRGCPKINLQVRETNAAIIEFYRSIGFTDDKVIGLGKRLEWD